MYDLGANEANRLFAAITANWRGRPLVSHEVIVNLIGATTTRTGLRVRSELDPRSYPAGLRISDAEMATLHLRTDAFHGEWNYTLVPRPIAHRLRAYSVAGPNA